MNRAWIALGIVLAGCGDSHVVDLSCGSDAECESGERCRDGLCTPRDGCNAPLALCEGRCIDVRTDARSCGACDRTCASGEVCSSGACVESCPSGLDRCGDGCFDLASSDVHCGACGSACNEGQACSTGACVASCGAGLRMCAGECADVRYDPSHCGACGAACEPANAMAACLDGECIVGACVAGFADCDAAPENGCETDLGQPATCGACDADCGRAAACEAGACAPYASCKDLLHRGGASADGVYAIEVGGEVLDVYCDMTTRGGGWTLLTNHVGSAGFFGDDAGGLETNASDPTAPLYSILGRVEAFARGGVYELFYWNRQHDQQLVSTQASSPLDASLIGACATDSTIVESTYTPGLFCGYTPGPATWSTINGYGPNWTHAVGQHREYGDWPLVCTHDTGYACNHIQLYVR